MRENCHTPKKDQNMALYPEIVKGKFYNKIIPAMKYHRNTLHMPTKPGDQPVLLR